MADAIAKAVTARRPRTRYAIGSGAKPMVVASRFLPDRTKDRMMTLVYKAAVRMTPANPAAAAADSTRAADTVTAGSLRTGDDPRTG